MPCRDWRRVMSDPLTWPQIVEHCSRLHTTRTRPEGPWGNAEPREDSRMLDIIIDGTPAVVVPTRMHEPGFYVRPPNGVQSDEMFLRSPADLIEFRCKVVLGRVHARTETAAA